MRAALIVARELLRCRLAVGGRDTLLERVAELLHAACRGAAPFCSLPMPQAVKGVHAGPRRARAPPGAPTGFDNTNVARGAALPTTTAPPPGGASSGGPLRGRAGVAPHGHQDQAPGLETQHAGHPGVGVPSTGTLVPHTCARAVIAKPAARLAGKITGACYKVVKGSFRLKVDGQVNEIRRLKSRPPARSCRGGF
jgi:hypothetical protein